MKPFFLADSVLVGATLGAAADQDFPVANITDRRPYTRWRGTGTGTQRITIDCGSNRTADTVAIAGHNLAGCTLTVETSPDGSSWSTVTTFTPGSNQVAVQAFGYIAGGKRFGKAVTSRHWALKISGANDIPTLGVLIIGSRLELPRFPLGSFVPETETAEIDNTESKSGHPLGSSIRYKPVDIKADIAYPGAEWVRGTYKPFYDAHMGQPVFFAWDLDDWPEMVYLGKIDPRYAPKYDALSRVESLPISFTGLRI